MTDWSLLDPMALYKGAAGTNAMMQRVARYKAGALLAHGDKIGAVNAVAEGGDPEGSQDFQLKLNENDDRLTKMTTEKRQQSAQLVQDAASVIDSIRQKQGNAAAVAGFQQLVPLFKQRGITDEELAPFVNGLQKDPEGFLNTVHAIATQHLKQYKLSPGDSQVDERGNVIASAPDRPQYKSVAAGGSLVQIPGAPSMAPANEATPASSIPPEAAALLKPGKVTKFGNGTQWTLGPDNQPQQVQ